MVASPHTTHSSVKVGRAEWTLNRPSRRGTAGLHYRVSPPHQHLTLD